MPNCVDYNCGDIGDHLQNECNELILGGSDSIGLLGCGHAITDFEDQTQLENAITSGELLVLKGVKLGIPLPTPIKVGPYTADEVSTVVNYERTANCVDPNYNQTNITLYNVIYNNKKFDGMLVRLKDSGKVLYVNSVITAEGSPVVPDDTNDAIRFETTFNWRSKESGDIFDDVTGVFD
jgi:hypothetical protein